MSRRASAPTLKHSIARSSARRSVCGYAKMLTLSSGPIRRQFLTAFSASVDIEFDPPHRSARSDISSPWRGLRTPLRPGSVKAFHEVSERFLGILRLDDAGGQEDARSPEAESLRDIFAAPDACATEDHDPRVRGMDSLDGRRDDLRFRGCHADVPSDQLRRLDCDVVRRELRERLTLREVVCARDDLKPELPAPGDRFRHLLPCDLPLAMVDERACRPRLEERLGRDPSGRLSRLRGVDVLPEDRDMHELRNVGEIRRGGAEDDRGARVILHRGEALRQGPTPLPEDLGVGLEVQDDGRYSHRVADGPSVGNRLGPAAFGARREGPPVPRIVASVTVARCQRATQGSFGQRQNSTSGSRRNASSPVRNRAPIRRAAVYPIASAYDSFGRRRFCPIASNSHPSSGSTTIVRNRANCRCASLSPRSRRMARYSSTRFQTLVRNSEARYLRYRGFPRTISMSA